MIEQKWTGRKLDKDFLVEGNKIYSQLTCVFIPRKVNNFIITSGKARGDYPIGVRLDKRKKKNIYCSECNDGSGVQHYLGMFPTPEQAHRA